MQEVNLDIQTPAGGFMPSPHAEEVEILKQEVKQNQIQIQQLYQLLGGFQDKLMNLEAFISGTPFVKPTGNEKIQ